MRHAHMAELIQQRPSIPWLEALTDNYLHPGGIARQNLLTLRTHYPIALHGVALSLGSSDPLNQDYLSQLKTLITDVEPCWVSEHLCWTSDQGQYSHELLPLPFTQDAINHLVARIQQVQDTLQRPLLIENVSSYLRYAANEFSEYTFIREIAQRAGCYILLDINNIYVNAHNHGLDPQAFLQQMPAAQVAEYHLAGYEIQDGYLLDSHGCAVHPPVWDLYQQALDYLGPRPTLIEWDNQLPELATLQQQAAIATQYLNAYANACTDTTAATTRST